MNITLGVTDILTGREGLAYMRREIMLPAARGGVAVAPIRTYLGGGIRR